MRVIRLPNPFEMMFGENQTEINVGYELLNYVGDNEDPNAPIETRIMRTFQTLNALQMLSSLLGSRNGDVIQIYSLF